MNLDKDTLQFLKEIDTNNNKDWFASQKKRFDGLNAQIKKFGSVIESGLNKTDEIEKMNVFRIYRDVRFSKDKSPYKNNLGIGFSRATVRKRGGYYIHIQPGESFVGGGFWEPNPADLKRIRIDLSQDFETIHNVANNDLFKKYFGQIEGESLSRPPQGFDKDNKNIDLIKKKQYLISRKFTDAEVLAPDFHVEVLKTFEAMRPFFDYMSIVLTTNSNGELIV